MYEYIEAKLVVTEFHEIKYQVIRKDKKS